MTDKTGKSVLIENCTSNQSRLMWFAFLYDLPWRGLHCVALKHSLALSLLVSLQSGSEEGRQTEVVIDTDKQVCLRENLTLSSA